MNLREEFLPRMYCYMGSGMLSNTYDEKVANENAKLCEEKAEEFAIGFTDWLQRLTPSQKVSVWSKDGQSKGLFNMDSEQLLQKYKKIVQNSIKK